MTSTCKLVSNFYILLIFHALRTKRELKKNGILYVTTWKNLLKNKRKEKRKPLIGSSGKSNLCLSLSSDERVPYLLKRDTTFKAVFRTHTKRFWSAGIADREWNDAWNVTKQFMTRCVMECNNMLLITERERK